MNNRFLVFGWYRYEQSGGANDCIGAAGALDKAKALALELRKKSLVVNPPPAAPNQYEYLQVFDVSNLETYFYDAHSNDWYVVADYHQLRARREAGVGWDRKALNL